MPRDFTSPQAVAGGQAGGKSVSNGAEVAALGWSQQLFPQLGLAAAWTVSVGWGHLHRAGGHSAHRHTGQCSLSFKAAFLSLSCGNFLD